jgi:hypothetical protein
VRKGKFEESISAKQIAKGEAATIQIDKKGNNAAAIFRYNPGKQKVIFPPHHPYRQVQDGVKKIVEVVAGNAYKYQNLSARRKELREWALKNLMDMEIPHPDLKEPVSFNSTSIKEFLNQPHKFLYEKNESIKDIKNLLHKSTLVKDAKDKNGNKNNHYYYLQTTINNMDSYVVIRETKHNNKFTLYTVTDHLKIK